MPRIPLSKIVEVLTPNHLDGVTETDPFDYVIFDGLVIIAPINGELNVIYNVNPYDMINNTPCENRRLFQKQTIPKVWR